MKARDVMTTPVVTVRDTATVQETASLLLSRGISAVPVIDASGALVGIVSEGDLVRRAEIGTDRRRSWWLSLFADSAALAQEFVKEHSRRVADVMTRNVVTATPDMPLGEIATLLERNAIKRVPILDDGKLVGIVSRANLLQALAALQTGTESASSSDDLTLRGRILERLSAEPWSPSWLNVTVQNGNVDLWGIARTASQKEAARVATELIPGVRSVKDNIVLRPAMNEGAY